MILIKISNMIIPILIFLLIIYALKKKINIYDSFVTGAKEGMEMGFSIFPYLLGMIFSINILLESNLLENIFLNLRPFFELIKVPVEILPISIIRPISGNATFAIMIDMIKHHGVDSYLGRLAATIQGGVDTTIYVLSLYFGSVGIKKIKYALWVGLFTDLVTIILSIIAVNLVF